VARVAIWAEVMIWAEMVSAQYSAVCIGQFEMHLIHCVSSVAADRLQCHFGKEGIRPSGFDIVQPGVFLSQPSPCYVQ
jgi:hypothetical protein